jgi:hypothetical protein
MASAGDTSSVIYHLLQELSVAELKGTHSQKQAPFKRPRCPAQFQLLRQEEEIGEARPASPEKLVQREGMFRLLA